MKQGVDTSILTGRPAGMPDEPDSERQKKQEAGLREKATYLGISTTAEGQQLIELVSTFLETRINHLIKSDAEASAYAKILADIGHKEDLARQAVNRLTQMLSERKEER